MPTFTEGEMISQDKELKIHRGSSFTCTTARRKGQLLSFAGHTTCCNADWLAVCLLGWVMQRPIKQRPGDTEGRGGTEGGKATHHLATPDCLMERH